MNKDNEIKKIFQNKLNQELKKIEFTNHSKKAVIDKVSKKKSIINRILNYEIKIPVKPVIAVGLACFIWTGLFSYNLLKIDEKDILESKIEVIYISSRR